MDGIRILFDAWMNAHSDNGQVKGTYLRMKREAPDARAEDPEMQAYLFQIEQQAFRGGFAKGFCLAVECLAEQFD